MTTPPLPTNPVEGSSPTPAIPSFQFEPQPESDPESQTTTPLPVSTEVPFSYTV